jgi:hypothetical protein
VEPGLITDTAMTERTLARLPEGVPAHRIPGDRTLTAWSLAMFICRTIQLDALWINGCSLRLDGGEL